jgi:hypothetical protein
VVTQQHNNNNVFDNGIETILNRGLDQLPLKIASIFGYITLNHQNSSSIKSLTLDFHYIISKYSDSTYKSK